MGVRETALVPPADDPLRQGSLAPSADDDAALVEVAKSPDYRMLFESQKRLFDLAMAASQMGTWRYTLADNVCIYDENAQRLYGLTEAAFLHDEEGVKSKFHPQDLELMWSRVTKALDPLGDGRYEVEYRVKQPDGTWRWLSAWGLVEFEGDGPTRHPIAIVGASRDLTERKHAEELQRLMIDELRHRINNTLSKVQAIVDQTLKTSHDLESAREALSRRICSMAKAHDLLTSRSWTGAALTDVVMQALDAFDPAQLVTEGPEVELSASQALAFGMILHELATNAAKYGALSVTSGQVAVQWSVGEDKVQLRWMESGGPPVNPPSRHGFGSRLLARIVASDLSGELALDYEPSGLRCSITAPL
jgi:two-component sensor histidine kinase